MLPRPGVTPRSASLAIRSCKSSLMPAARAAPSRISALMLDASLVALHGSSLGGRRATCASAHSRSMLELPLTREDHRQPMLVGGGDDLVVPERAAGLDDAGDACGRDRIE